MPAFPWTKSNKSHQSVDNTSPGQSSPVPSAKDLNEQVAAQRYQASDGHQAPLHSQQPSVQQQQQQQLQQSPPASARNRYSEPSPQRTASHRLSAHLSLGQAPQNYQQQPGPPPPSQPGLEPQNHASYPPSSPPPAYSAEPKKQSLRSRIAAGVRGHKDEEAKQKSSGLNRRQSVRKSDPRAQEYQAQGDSRLPHWHHHGSSSHLPTSREQDEDNLDPYLQQEETPQVPPKDSQYQPNLPRPKQFVAQPHQEPYVRPPLGRVSTEGSYSTQGGVDHYSPEQHQHQSQGLQQSQSQQVNHGHQQSFQSYQPAPPHSQAQGNFSGFNTQNSSSSLLQGIQLHGHNASVQDNQQNYYQYQQQQQQQQQQQPQQQQSPSNPNQSSLENSQQSLHPQHQPHFAPQLQQQSDQQPPPSQLPPQIALSISQQQTEAYDPQATRQHIPAVQQQIRQVEPQQSQQRRPLSSHQLAPPSPLQPTPYQHYEAQQAKHQQSSDLHPPSNAPQNKGPEVMTPSAPGNNRNIPRKPNEGSQPQPGAPSREPSLLQQPTISGQTHGQPAVSPGVATFDANVVPTASQGQPTRADKQGQQGSEMGRGTPPPRAPASEMTEEEIEKMIKEHDVLREKYQKVKRYFFEQQSQVHQLQNTLANQRLSLSRTSWDDSEYSTRFNRLDGLIAQLSFSIRKDWKTIPQWLHPVVNKTAVETGKQEMTAVGRAFISHWLVENIFDKYFHPDLEPGLSTQLQLIVSNIRRFSPPCHTAEEEDSLAAKIINWRLATLEGLADSFREPQATNYREALIGTLNEKLIASLQMHLNDPAPPDLNGGVPMIIELAVSIAQHLPLESREVHIEYFTPGHGIVSDLMKLESGIPALTAPILEMDDADRASVRSMASKHDDNISIAEQEQAQAQGAQPPKEDKKRSMFGFGAAKKTSSPASLGKRESSLGQGGSQQSLTQNPQGGSNGAKDESVPPRVRMAVGLAVQIRGKTVLIKAPVYST